MMCVEKGCNDRAVALITVAVPLLDGTEEDLAVAICKKHFYKKYTLDEKTPRIITIPKKRKEEKK